MQLVVADHWSERQVLSHQRLCLMCRGFLKCKVVGREPQLYHIRTHPVGGNLKKVELLIVRYKGRQRLFAPSLEFR